jgi:hypothetical protein
MKVQPGITSEQCSNFVMQFPRRRDQKDWGSGRQQEHLTRAHGKRQRFFGGIAEPPERALPIQVARRVRCPGLLQFTCNAILYVAEVAIGVALCLLIRDRAINYRNYFR